MSSTSFNNSRRAFSIIFYIALTLFSMIIVVPLFLILLNSFKTNVEASVISLSLPEKFMLGNYMEVIIKGKVLRAFGNAVLITTVSVSCVILFSSIASFIIQRRDSKMSLFLYRLFLIGMIAPLSLIPEIKILQTFNIMGTYLGIILVHIAVNIPFSVVLYTGFIKGIPRQMDEAAVIDGCKPLRLFFQIVFPLLKPVIFTNLVIVFMSIWNDFQYTLYFVAKSSMWTMPMTVYNFLGFHTADYNLVCADIILTILPVLVVFLLAQKYIISGMTAGAIKG